MRNAYRYHLKYPRYFRRCRFRYAKNLPMRWRFRNFKHSKINEIWISSLGRPNKSGPATLSLFGKSEWVKATDKKPVFLSFAALQERLRHYATEIPDLKQISDQMACTENKNWSPQSSTNVCIILLDDVIGTQGQLFNYFSKLLDSRVIRPNDPILSPIPKKFGKKLVALGFQFHVVFALGVGTHYGGPQKIIDPKSGITFTRHVAYQTKTLHNLIVEFGVIFEKATMKMLKKYRHITATRVGEFPCQFEPAGWKGERVLEPDLVKGNGGLFSTYANTPGNSLPIIWGSENDRQPLFRRYFNQLVPTSNNGDNSKDNMLCRNVPKAKCRLYPGSEICAGRTNFLRSNF